MTALAGKKAIVTGAARGIGAAIAERFAAEGASVMLADRDESVSAVAARLGQIAACTNVAKKAEIDALFAQAEAAWGGLDILVNNAGILHKAELDDVTEEAFDQVMMVNVKAAFHTTQHAARMMARGGSIINMSSINAELAIPNQIPYAVSKGAIKQLTNVTAIALAPRGIRVNAIGPGTILTDMAQSIMADSGTKYSILSRTPLGRLGKADEIANVATFLASDQSSYITGQTIYADGGRQGLNYTVSVSPHEM